MKAVLDTNVIIYAIDGADDTKSAVAKWLLDQALRSNWITPRQLIGELLAVGHRRGGAILDNMRLLAKLIETALSVVDTSATITQPASALAERYTLQYFDAVICLIARDTGATILFTEDMHDGLEIGSLKIVNPFAAGNRSIIEQLGWLHPAV